MKIGAGVIFYNARQELRRCLDSLRKFDKVIAIDGKFPNHPGTTRYSNDWSAELCKKYENVDYYRCARDQVKKRNLYLDVAKILKLDYLLIMDSDSYVRCPNWDLFYYQLEENLKDNHIMYLVNFLDESKNTYKWLYLFKPQGLKYSLLHNRIVHTCGMPTLIPWSPDEKLVEGIEIVHDKKLRTAHQRTNSNVYRRAKQPIESVIREKLGYMPYMRNEI